MHGEKGYFDAFIYTRPDGTKRIIWLPNTTLWKRDTTASQAYNDIVECLKQYEDKTHKKHDWKNASLTSSQLNGRPSVKMRRLKR